MKAACYERYGLPDVLTICEIDMPVRQSGEVLVKVHHSVVNRSDCAMLSAHPFIMRLFTGLLKPKKPVLGTVFSGEVVAVGEDVQSFKTGDRVFGFDDGGLSAYAEYLTIAEDGGITTIPENVSYEQAAAAIEGAHYAYNFISKVEILPGQRVLVNGASGAIGSALVQLLQVYDIEITAVCGGRNIDRIKALGIERVIDYTTVDFTKLDQQFDIVFDAVGKSTFGQCRSILKPKGIYLSSELGPYIQNIFLALATPLFGRKRVIFPVPVNITRSLIYLQKLMAQEKFTAVIDRSYPLEQIADAFRYVETGHKVGNVMIKLS